MKELIKRLKATFIEVFGGDESGLRVFAAPGRVNLIGEHTDYNGGFVFPAALTLGTVVIARPRQDEQINLYAEDLQLKVGAALSHLEGGRELRWGNYQLGVADELLKAGYDLCGCDMLFYMDLPHKSGLSSSASIEVATAVTLATLGREQRGKPGSFSFSESAAERKLTGDEPVDMIEMAVISQRAEHNFIGVKCGIMDQFASAMGKKDMAIFLQCRDLKYRHVPLKLDGYRIVISNTNCKRSLAASKYNERREQCEAGLEILKTFIPEATCLGDISMDQYRQYGDAIKDPVIRNRVEFVIGENDRVLQSVEALEKNDIALFGKLMIDAHHAIRDLYEVTGPELDTLFEEALRIDGVAGSRMTGAGFGGCTVSIVKEDCVEKFIQEVGREYTAKTGLTPAFYVCEPGDGGREIII